MNRIGNVFQNKPIFTAYSPLGYPDLEISIDVIKALAKHRADLIEVGSCFSDLRADGPVIQQATQRALEKGITLKKSLEAVKELRPRSPLSAIPLIQMLVPTTPNERIEMISRRGIYLSCLGDRRDRSTHFHFRKMGRDAGTSQTSRRAGGWGHCRSGVRENDRGSRTPVETAKQFAAEFRSALSDLNE